MNWRNLRVYLLARAGEPSTWRGLMLVGTGLGISVAPERLELIVSLGTITAGIIGALAADK